MSYLTVKASEVRKGDSLYIENKSIRNPNHKWHNVRRVTRTNQHSAQPKQIVITTKGLDSIFDPGDDVLIQRFDDTEE